MRKGFCRPFSLNGPDIEWHGGDREMGGRDYKGFLLHNPPCACVCVCVCVSIQAKELSMNWNLAIVQS